MLFKIKYGGGKGTQYAHVIGRGRRPGTWLVCKYRANSDRYTKPITIPGSDVITNLFPSNAVVRRAMFAANRDLSANYIL